jgi:hypothetical protein
MKKIVISVLSTVSALPLVLADGLKNKTGTCAFYGAKGGHWMAGWGLLKVVYILITVFLISTIFWWTYRWIVVNKGLTKKKGKKK